eukprot:m.37315 g.37315  ORF g.37315 m.37315 type:complete len:406 (+) comp10084_c0_seq9:60-1277(+)
MIHVADAFRRTVAVAVWTLCVCGQPISAQSVMETDCDFPACNTALPLCIVVGYTPDRCHCTSAFGTHPPQPSILSTTYNLSISTQYSKCYEAMACNSAMQTICTQLDDRMECKETNENGAVCQGLSLTAVVITVIVVVVLLLMLASTLATAACKENRRRKQYESLATHGEEADAMFSPSESPIHNTPHDQQLQHLPRHQQATQDRWADVGVPMHANTTQLFNGGHDVAVFGRDEPSTTVTTLTSVSKQRLQTSFAGLVSSPNTGQVTLFTADDNSSASTWSSGEDDLISLDVTLFATDNARERPSNPAPADDELEVEVAEASEWPYTSQSDDDSPNDEGADGRGLLGHGITSCHNDDAHNIALPIVTLVSSDSSSQSDVGEFVEVASLYNPITHPHLVVPQGVDG